MIATESKSRSRSDLLAAIGEGELDQLSKERFVAVTTIAEGSVRRVDLWWAQGLVVAQAYMDDDAIPANTRALRCSGAPECMLAELLGRRDSDSSSLALSFTGGDAMDSLLRSATVETKSCPARLILATVGGVERRDGARGVVVVHDSETRWAAVTPGSQVLLRSGELPAMWVAVQGLIQRDS